MQRTINDTLDYIMFLTRHVRKKNVSGAILTVLLELRCPEYHEGFGYLREAIFLKYVNSDMRFGPIYRAIAEMHDVGTTSNQVEQDIRAVIGTAWANRDDETWAYIFPEDRKGILCKPSNGRFIARCACLMELWMECCEEDCYAG